jgi:hypothetical protein
MIFETLTTKSEAEDYNHRAQVRPDEASHRHPVFREGAYPERVLPLGGDRERPRREGAGGILGSYRISVKLPHGQKVKN